MATAVLLDAGVTEHDDADTAENVVVATERFQTLFKKNWILNQSITGQQGKDSKEAMEDIVNTLADEVRKILVKTTDGKEFLNQIEKSLNQIEGFLDLPVLY